MRRRVLLTSLLALGLVAAGLSPAVAGRKTVADASVTAPVTIHAPQAWADGVDGSGVGIAVIDTGVSPEPSFGDHVAGQLNLSGTGRQTDGHGHGTFLTGLMIGEDGPDGVTLGVAPGAHVVSFKVADAAGDTSLEQVLAAIAAVRVSAEELGIRVVVLALGGPADNVPDPIEAALEQLWADGFVVVVASGNDGGTVTEPGVSPYLLTVGAVDDQGTASLADDQVPAWSGAGVGRDGQPKPDVLAPGVSVVSVRVPGSTADRENPGSRIEGRWFRGSGTSMSAAVAAGAAALLLEARPELTPDQVKGRLMASAHPVAGSTAGTIDVAAAIDGPDVVANTDLPPLTAIDLADLTPSDWQGMSWIADAWDGMSWIGMSWIGDAWAGMSWIGMSWIGMSWIGMSWINHGWAGMSWIGMSWIGDAWDGMSWIDGGWSADHWVGRSWTAAAFR